MQETEFERLAAERAATRERDPALFDRVVAILHRHDPMGIAVAENPDEYAAEAGTIIPHLHLAINAEEVETIIAQEMTFWFGEDMAPPEEGFGVVAVAVWEAWEDAG